MRLLPCLFVLLSACARPIHARYPDVQRIVMRDARTFTLVVGDGARWRPVQLRADDVTILADVPANGMPWAEFVDAPGEFNGEGDRLILHVRSLSDIE